MSQGATAPPVEAPRPASVAAAVVTFHPDRALEERLAALSPLVSAIILVDNGSAPDELRSDRLASLGGKLQLIANGRNRGVAAALNQGFARARTLGLPWLLALDQDSEPLPCLVEAAARVFDSHPLPARLAAIGAGIAGEIPSDPASQHPFERRPVLITSGTLYPLSVWESMGGFREDFFIDYVDIEYCLRARARGLEVVQSTEPCLVHRIGQPAARRVLGRWVTPTHHDATRRYYITRNRIAVWRGYALTETRYVLHDIRAFTRETFMLVVAESDRLAKIRAMWAGIRDGSLGRSRRR